MDRSVAMFLVGLILGGGIGFVVAAANGVTLDGHDHAVHDDHAPVSGMGSTVAD